VRSAVAPAGGDGGVHLGCTEGAAWPAAMLIAFPVKIFRAGTTVWAPPRCSRLASHAEGRADLGAEEVATGLTPKPKRAFFILGVAAYGLTWLLGPEAGERALLDLDRERLRLVAAQWRVPSDAPPPPELTPARTVREARRRLLEAAEPRVAGI
jgi:hypothetical protein